MAKTTHNQSKIDATRPFYAVVGVGDWAVEHARTAASDVQARLAKVDLEPKALRDQAESYVNDAVSDLSETVADLNEGYTELAARGKDLVKRIRRQQATQDAKASAETTVAKAKTARTQTTKAARRSSTEAATAAKRTAGPAKTSTKATGTAAKKTATAGGRATRDAAGKIGD